MTSGPVRPMQASGQGDPSYQPPQLTPQPPAPAPEHRAESYAPPSPAAAPAELHRLRRQRPPTSSTLPMTTRQWPSTTRLKPTLRTYALWTRGRNPSRWHRSPSPKPIRPHSRPRSTRPRNRSVRPSSDLSAAATHCWIGAAGQRGLSSTWPQAPNLPFQADAGSAGRGQGGEGGFRAIGNFVRNTFNQLQPQAAPSPNQYDTPLPSTAPTRDFALQGQDSAGPDAQVPQRAQPHQYGLEDTSGFDLNDFDKTLNGVPDFLRRNNN